MHKHTVCTLCIYELSTSPAFKQYIWLLKISRFEVGMVSGGSLQQKLSYASKYNAQTYCVYLCANTQTKVHTHTHTYTHMHTDLHYVCAHLHTLSLCIFTYIVYTNILMYTPCTYTCTQMYTPCTHHAHICTHMYT